MYIVQEEEFVGERLEAPFGREVKHLVADWNAGATKLWVGVSVIDPASASNPHTHQEQEEVFYCLSGRGLIRAGGEEAELRPGSCVFIPQGVEHQLANSQPDEVLRILYATAPAFSREGWSAVHQSGERLGGR